MASSSQSRSNLVRYLLIAAASLFVGVVINLTIGNGSVEHDFFNPSFYLLLVMYSIFHIAALSITAILSTILPNRIRPTLYLSLSAIGFLVSVYILGPSKLGGLHLFVIFWGSLVLVALDYAWRVNRQPREDEPSS